MGKDDHEYFIYNNKNRKQYPLIGISSNKISILIKYPYIRIMYLQFKNVTLKNVFWHKTHDTVHEKLTNNTE